MTEHWKLYRFGWLLSANVAVFNWLAGSDFRERLHAAVSTLSQGVLGVVRRNLRLTQLCKTTIHAYVARLSRAGIFENLHSILLRLEHSRDSPRRQYTSMGPY